MKHRIGERITITEDFEIHTSIGEQTIQIKKGDTGFIDSRGCVHYITGNARGKIQAIEDIDMKGYSHESISELIFKRLNSEYNLAEILECEDIMEHDFRNVIEDVLTDIL